MSLKSLPSHHTKPCASPTPLGIRSTHQGVGQVGQGFVWSRLTRSIRHHRLASGISLTVVLVLLSTLFTSESHALKPLLDQADDMGYSEPLIKEVSRLFPDSRRDHALRELEDQRSPLSTQVLSDHNRKAVEESLYHAIFDRVTDQGMAIENLSVSYLGRMQVKVLLAVRTKDLPYARIRESLAKLRQIVEMEVLPQSFVGYSLAQLSTFTVMNRKNGKVYEYPVLYHNVELPWYSSDKKRLPPHAATDSEAVEDRMDSKLLESHMRDQAPSAEMRPDGSAQSPHRNPPGESGAGYVMEDFLGSPRAGSAGDE